MGRSVAKDEEQLWHRADLVAVVALFARVAVEPRNPDVHHSAANMRVEAVMHRSGNESRVDGRFGGKGRGMHGDTLQ